MASAGSKQKDQSDLNILFVAIVGLDVIVSAFKPVLLMAMQDVVAKLMRDHKVLAASAN